MTKLAVDQAGAESLRCEASANMKAQELGVPVVPVIRQSVTPNLGVLLEFPHICERWTLLPQERDVAAAPAKLSAAVASLLGGHCGRPLTVDDAVCLHNRDPRNGSLAAFDQTWLECTRTIALAGNDGSAETRQLLASLDIASFLAATKFSRYIVDDLIQPTNGAGYFCHNDTMPSNFAFSRVTGEATLLDFEHAGAACSPVLAQITDIGYFFSHIWPNPDMQAYFIEESLRAEWRGVPQGRRADVVAAAICLGTMLEFTWNLSTPHPNLEQCRALGARSTQYVSDLLGKDSWVTA